LIVCPANVDGFDCIGRPCSCGGTAWQVELSSAGPPLIVADANQGRAFAAIPQRKQAIT
jgi:hypothetical protein